VQLIIGKNLNNINMKKTTTIILGLLISVGSVFAQPPKVYINFVSHNEPGDNLQNSFKFNIMAPKVLQLATIIDSKGASWNLQTCDGFAKGALDFQGATSNVFKTLEQAPYSDNMEIDPRNKQTLYPTIADLYHILDSLGANPTKTLGGFLYYSNIPSPQPDWFEYQDTIVGITYPNVEWKCNLMWGAGSTSPIHCCDLNDYGIWKPDTVDNFYSHNSSRPVWFIGNGCQPILALDSTENPQDIIAPLKNFIDSVQNGLLPQDKFYVYSITINQSHFGPMLFQKISTICDSINSWGTDKIQWATLTEKIDSFTVWQQTPNDYSLWLCGQTVTGINEEKQNDDIVIYPNPFNDIITIDINDGQKHKVEIVDFLGRVIYTDIIHSDTSVDLSKFLNGIYLVRIDDRTIKSIKH